jgi:replicative DNA helicase
MAPLELLRRITARVTGTFLGKFKTGELPPAQMATLARQAIKTTPALALLDSTDAYATGADILNGAEVTRRLDPENPHLLIVVDSLHSWAEKGQGDEYVRLAEHLAALKQIAARLKCPVLAISERNRASMKDGGLSAGAGHRGIEYGAETVFDLDCKADAQPDANGEIEVTLKIQKNRNGAKGKRIELLFNGALQRFRETER